MLADEVKKLKEEVIALKKDLSYKNMRLHLAEKTVEHYKELAKMVIPNQVYVCKARRNTTVKFLDGSSVTVKRKADEKDCIETAIAYCVLKQLMPAKDLKKLIEEREEH